MISDEALEREIGIAYTALLHARSLEAKRAYLALMTRLIAQRSPAQVARMEHERGLR